MAEIAIPMLLLGTAYLYSNQNDNDDNLESENFSNLNTSNVLEYKDGINNYHGKYYHDNH